MLIMRCLTSCIRTPGIHLFLDLELERVNVASDTPMETGWIADWTTSAADLDNRLGCRCWVAESAVPSQLDLRNRTHALSGVGVGFRVRLLSSVARIFH